MQRPRHRPNFARRALAWGAFAWLWACLALTHDSAAQQIQALGQAWLPTPQPSFAPQTQLLSLPMLAPNKSMQQLAVNGLTLNISSRGLPGLGYRPIAMAFTALAPSPADRALTVEFTTHHRWAANQAVRVTQHVDLPAGASSVIATVRVPQYEAWDSFGVKVWEDGALLEELSLDRAGTGGVNYNESLPRVLVVGPDTVDLTGLTLAAGGAHQQQYGGQHGGQIVTPQTIARQTAAELSEDWLDYTTFDLVAVPWDQLQSIIQNRPQAWLALRRWLSLGGNLVVYQKSDDWKWLDTFERVAQPPGETKPLAQVVGEPSGGESTRPAEGAVANTVSALANASKVFLGRLPKQPTLVLPAPAGWTLARPPSPGEPHNPYSRSVKLLPANWQTPERLLRLWEMGQVLAYRRDPLSSDPAVWQTIWSELGDVRIAAAPRLGLSGLSPNHDFWNLLVPNVGLPPVDAFRVLITLFVVIIGPVNYFVLRRLQRLHLLVFIVPAAALLVTFSLLAYAVLGDGLGVKLRSRTLTILDQPRGEGACWSRLSYYAGLAPSGGLVFSDETAVYPLQAQPSPMGRGQATRVLVWGRQQNLTRGWLSSRTPTQFVTQRATATSAALAVSPSASGLRLENRLGAEVLQIVLADDQGRYFHAGGLAAGDAAQAGEVALAEGLAKLAPLISAARPEAPAEISVYQSQVQRSYGWSGYDSPWPDPRQETSRLEQAFEQLSMAGTLGRLPLGPRSYAAVVRRSPLAETGYEPVEEAGELHLILGRW